MKKLFTAALAVAALTMITGCTKKETSNGKVLNIYCWNEEFQGRFNDYYAAKLPVDVTVNWMITPSQDSAYQNKLDEALLRQDEVPADEKIDIFLVESKMSA